MQPSPELTATFVALLAVAIAGYALYRARQPLTVRGVTSALQKGTATATEIAEIVKAGVFAAEQLKRTGRLPDNNAAFNYAYGFAKSLLPDLDRATLTTFIESFVPLANQIVDALPDKAPPHIPPDATHPPVGRMGL